RFLALMPVTGLLDVYALIFGIFGGVLAALVYHQSLAGFWATFFANASVTDLWGSIVKTTLFGAIISIVCCYKGITASGGAAGVFSAWCDLREMVPYMFGYIMSAKVGTGIVAELGAMRINEEIDALEVMGVRPITFLAATRLLAAWMVLPFIYISAVGVGFLA